MALSAYFREGPLTRIVKIVMDQRELADISLGFTFYVFPYYFWADSEPTIATVSVQGLPPLDPNVLKVNSAPGMVIPPGMTDVYYGGISYFTMPDGEGTLDGGLTLLWGDRGLVGYHSAGSSRPFFGENFLQIALTLQLRRLDFISSPSDNHYDWGVFPAVSGLGIDLPSQEGTAGSAATLRFVLSVTVNPPSATFTAG